MAKTKEYSTSFKETVLAALQKGGSQSSVARQFHISRQLLSSWTRVFRLRGTLGRIQRPGRPRKTSVRVDRLIQMRSVGDPRLTATAINRDLKVFHGVDIHVSTVKRRLQERNLNGRRPSQKPLISTKNRKARIEFAKRYELWTPEQWSEVLWSDESKFYLVSSDGIRYVRRPVNARDDVRYQVPTVKHGGGHVMVWGCFSRHGIGPLVKVDGVMDRFKYRDILNNSMLDHARATFEHEWFFQYDNDPKHTSGCVKSFLEENEVNVLDWPSQSPDRNPIEHLWNYLDLRVRQRQFSNPNSFFQVLREEWGKNGPKIAAKPRG